MTSNAEMELKVAETAYGWLKCGNYGSEENAVRALRRRRRQGMRELSREAAKLLLAKAVEILVRTEELREETACRYGRSSFYRLSEEQFRSGGTEIREALTREFPRYEATINYMMGMLWELAYWR